MRILHTGDLHLDSPFSGLDIGRSERRRREMRETFSRMMRYARDEHFDMVVISGDLFDSSFVTRETVSLLVREFASVSCPVIITPGNHDPYTEDSVWKKTEFSGNVHIFKERTLEKLSFDSLGCDVYGYAFTSSVQGECCVGGRVQDSDRINILVAHADTTSPISNYSPLPVAVIRSFGADFALLGHVHNPDGANAPLEGLGAYCGCPEGRDFGELGEKGALALNIEKGNVTVEKIRFSKRVYLEYSLSIDGAEDMGSILSEIESLIAKKGLGEEHLVRITLTGAVSPSLVINTKVLSEPFGSLFSLEVVDATSPTWNAEGLLADRGIRGELYRTLLPRLESSDRNERETASLALRYALAALVGQDISDI